MTEKRFFHYTTMFHLPRILERKVLQLATGHIEKNEKPVLWFSWNLEWEATASKHVARDRAGTREECDFYYGLARVEVPELVCPHDWMHFIRNSGISRKEAARLEDKALLMGGNSANWRVSYEPVTQDKWLGVEIFVGGWTKYDADVWAKENSFRVNRRAGAGIKAIQREDLERLK